MELDNRKIYYVYEWYNEDTGEIFYVGKGRGNRCRGKAPTKRSIEFVNYIKENQNCTYRKVIENVDEETACIEEDKRIKKLKAQGLCTCNLTDRTSYRGISCGANNGMYGKHHTEESRRKMSEANLNGRNAGENNSQYGISPKDRMSPEVYAEWLYKQQNNKNGDMNGRAVSVVAFNDNERHEFSCIRYCCDFLRERFDIDLSNDSMITRISECIRCGLKYKGFYFDSTDESFAGCRRVKFSVRIREDLFNISTSKSKELDISLSDLILYLIKYGKQNNIRFEIGEKISKKVPKTLRFDKNIYDEWLEYVSLMGVKITDSINQLLEKFINGEIVYEG